jgi:hypothetical protein
MKSVEFVPKSLGGGFRWNIGGDGFDQGTLCACMKTT